MGFANSSQSHHRHGEAIRHHVCKRRDFAPQRGRPKCGDLPRLGRKEVRRTLISSKDSQMTPLLDRVLAKIQIEIPMHAAKIRRRLNRMDAEYFSRVQRHLTDYNDAMTGIGE